jgi:hypothetical protein
VRLWFLAGSVFVVVMSGVSARAVACSLPSFSVIQLDGPIPVDNAIDVPVNVTPLVRIRDQFGAALDPVSLHDPAGNEVECQRVIVSAGDEQLLKLIPTTVLPASTTYEIVSGDTVLSSFTTGLSADTEAPPIPELSGPRDSQRTSLIVSTSAEASVVLAAIGVDPVLDDGAEAGAVAEPGSFEIFGPPGRVEVRAVAVDLAGNISAVATLDAEILEESSAGGCTIELPAGCASTPGSAPLALGSALLLMLRGRRSRR